MAATIFLLGNGSSALFIPRSGNQYRPDVNGLISVLPQNGSDVADLCAAGCSLVNTAAPTFARFLTTPFTSYTVDSGRTYTANAAGIILCPTSNNPDSVNLVTAGCEGLGLV